jgi:hypothetical protein
MAVHQLPSEHLTTNEQLKTTASLRMEIQDDITRLQAVIKSANETIKRARLTIVQLSLHEDRAYAQEAEAAAVETPPAAMPIRA